jgi:hypothetical protein
MEHCRAWWLYSSNAYSLIKFNVSTVTLRRETEEHIREKVANLLSLLLVMGADWEGSDEFKKEQTQPYVEQGEDKEMEKEHEEPTRSEQVGEEYSDIFYCLVKNIKNLYA